MAEDKLKTMLLWATRNRAEDAFDHQFYYWTPDANKIFMKLTILGGQWGDKLLIGVIGNSGVGKSALLNALAGRLRANYVQKYALQFKNYNEEHFASVIDRSVFCAKWDVKEKSIEYMVRAIADTGPPNTALIDTVDYGKRDIRKIHRDLSDIFNLWSKVRSCSSLGTVLGSDSGTVIGRVNFVIFMQKELVKGADHFFLRKMDIMELKPLTPEQLVEAFKMRFTTSEPFNEDSLKLVAELSRGIFRRFMKYIRLCLEDIIVEGKNIVSVEDVKKSVTTDILLQDLDLELSDIFRNERYKRFAVEVLQFVRENPNVNQKTVADALGIHEGILSRIMATLQSNGYVKRSRGKERGEWLILAC
jgi:GTPase SAR1 family protein